jgi:Ca2+-binding EF-hand superfamily protein
MKKTLLIGGLAALTLVGGAAVAQQAPTASRGLARADTDGDGRLSQAEFVARRVDRLGAADANRDGSVTAEERRAAWTARRAERRTGAFDRLDADKDGMISRAEFEAPRAARADRPARAGRPMARAARMDRTVSIAEAQAKAQQAFARLDADGDGFLTADEQRAGRAAMRQQRMERRAERRAARQASPQPPASE